MAPPVAQPSAAASYSWPSPESTESDKLLDVSVFSRSSKICLPCYSCRSHVASPFCFLLRSVGSSWVCVGQRDAGLPTCASRTRNAKAYNAAPGMSGNIRPTQRTCVPPFLCRHVVSTLTFFVSFLLQVARGGPARFSPDLGSLYYHSSCHSQATTQMYLSPPRMLYGMGLAWYDSD